MKHKHPINLDNRQQSILNEFIHKFLPARGNKIKRSGNEIEKITNRLDRIFLKYFDIRLDRAVVLKTFEDLGYSIYTKKGIWNKDYKSLIPATDGKHIKAGDVYEENDTMFIYVDMHGPTLEELHLTAFPTDPNTSLEKVLRTEKLKSDIMSFINTLPE